MKRVILGLAFALALGGAAHAQRAETGEEMLTVSTGWGAGLQTRLCRPQRQGDVPLVVVNHGSPANAAARASMRPWACTSGVARWFLQRGYAVAFPTRRGYGQSGGGWAETYGSCSNPDFASAGRAGAEDIAAVVQHVTGLPGIARGRTLIVGHSAGGWASLAYAATNPSGVVGIVNVAGGRGGRQTGPGVVGTNCSPDALARAAASFGSARVPTLWLYTANDSFFAPDLARAMFENFRGAGGNGTLVALGAWGGDGHQLFAGGGTETWGPRIANFLATIAR